MRVFLLHSVWEWAMGEARQTIRVLGRVWGGRYGGWRCNTLMKHTVPSKLEYLTHHGAMGRFRRVRHPATLGWRHTAPCSVLSTDGTWLMRNVAAPVTATCVKYPCLPAYLPIC
jgi:hypothetical protein